MFKKDIDKKYTEKIMEYLNKGYTIHTNTMNGSQGELAKVDLTNGKEVIRIYMDRTYIGFSDKVIVILVGRNTCKLYDSESDIIWNSKLEIIEKMEFVKIGENYYIPKEDFAEIHKKRRKRINKYSDDYITYIFHDEAKKIILPFVKRQPKCKSARLSDIKEVKKTVSKNRYTNKYETKYYVTVKNKTYRIGGNN